MRRTASGLTYSQIDAWFDEYVHGFMFADIAQCIRAKANYGAALMLLTYTEVIGGLSNGHVAVSGNSTPNFKDGLTLLDHGFKRYDPDNYTQGYYSNFRIHLLGKSGKKRPSSLYEVARCGMVHEYFAKGQSVVVNNPKLPAKPKTSKYGPGAMGWHGSKFFIHTNLYFAHFKEAVAHLRIEIRNKTLKANFEKAYRELRRTVVP